MPRTTYEAIVLVNPNWRFEGSGYWACPETHLPLELLYSQAMLANANVASTVVDAHLESLALEDLVERVSSLRPELIVITTAPSYLFWRCPQPELTVPAEVSAALSRMAPVVAMGPHGSATPQYVLNTLGCQGVVRGEPEEELVRLALGLHTPAVLWSGDSSSPDAVRVARTDPSRLPALTYQGYPIERRTHRHHVFWGEGRGAEVEASRGCPYQCSFCNRRFFRSRYRERPAERVLAEMHALKARDIDYVYFIDEVFGLPGSEGLLRALEAEPVMTFGCQTRLDLWDEPRLDRLAAAGCISVEFGLESPFPEVQTALRKGYQMEPERIIDLMSFAKERIPWVQGDLVRMPGETTEMRRKTEEWRKRAIDRGVWVSEPVKLFPYPGCDMFDQVAGPVDEDAWLKAQRMANGGND